MYFGFYLIEGWNPYVWESNLIIFTPLRRTFFSWAEHTLRKKTGLAIHEFFLSLKGLHVSFDS